MSNLPRDYSFLKVIEVDPVISPSYRNKKVVLQEEEQNESKNFYGVHSIWTDRKDKIRIPGRSFNGVIFNKPKIQLDRGTETLNRLQKVKEMNEKSKNDNDDLLLQRYLKEMKRRDQIMLKTTYSLLVEGNFPPENLFVEKKFSERKAILMNLMSVNRQAEEYSVEMTNFQNTKKISEKLFEGKSVPFGFESVLSSPFVFDSQVFIEKKEHCDCLPLQFNVQTGYYEETYMPILVPDLEMIKEIFPNTYERGVYIFHEVCPDEEIFYKETDIIKKYESVYNVSVAYMLRLGEGHFFMYPGEGSDDNDYFKIKTQEKRNHSRFLFGNNGMSQPPRQGSNFQYKVLGPVFDEMVVYGIYLNSRDTPTTWEFLMGKVYNCVVPRHKRYYLYMFVDGRDETGKILCGAAIQYANYDMFQFKVIDRSLLRCRLNFLLYVSGEEERFKFIFSICFKSVVTSHLTRKRPRII